jgi:predicted dehydrogenase
LAASGARLVLVGVSGYGRIHAENIARLAESGQVELVAGVDPAFTEEPRIAYGAPVYDDLTDALKAAGPVDVVVIAAPIGLHFALAETALTAGADVLLEKPPVASLDDFENLLAIEEATGRVVQVGFQSLGSHAIDLLTQDAYGIAPVSRVSAFGAWSRTVGYWTRSAWAGRRSLHGRPIVDGVVTNALAHAVATALAVIGCRRADDVETVETDLYRANAIDADDTSVVRIRTTRGLEVTCALSLSAPVEREPLVQIEGSTGRAVLEYKTDRIEIQAAGGKSTETTGRTDLLENLLAHRRDGTPLLVPLASTGAFMRVLGAVAAADEPLQIDPRAIEWHGEGPDRRAVVTGIDDWLSQAAASGRTFAELGVPWARRS